MQNDFTNKIRSSRQNALMSLRNKQLRTVRSGGPELFQHLDTKDIGDLFARSQLRFSHRAYAL
jgi:hypothetical protein